MSILKQFRINLLSRLWRSLHDYDRSSYSNKATAKQIGPDRWHVDWPRATNQTLSWEGTATDESEARAQSLSYWLLRGHVPVCDCGLQGTVLAVSIPLEQTEYPTH